MRFFTAGVWWCCGCFFFQHWMHSVVTTAWNVRANFRWISQWNGPFWIPLFLIKLLSRLCCMLWSPKHFSYSRHRHWSRSSPCGYEIHYDKESSSTWCSLGKDASLQEVNWWNWNDLETDQVWLSMTRTQGLSNLQWTKDARSFDYTWLFLFQQCWLPAPVVYWKCYLTALGGHWISLETGWLKCW